ncbi:hypothetical protein EYF80_028229 [Liparis tanakae]|uniref:Uncharacterized protein n=1 Tax=Liparis tanakae TaxID=230148 RepID=A0A4Z2H9D3_9TELE|nr:hypothetical protein EYF80_028229 [Liparis tanakae]
MAAVWVQFVTYPAAYLHGQHGSLFGDEGVDERQQVFGFDPVPVHVADGQPGEQSFLLPPPPPPPHLVASPGVFGHLAPVVLDLLFLLLEDGVHVHAVLVFVRAVVASFSFTTFSLTTFSLTTFSLTTFSFTTFSFPFFLPAAAFLPFPPSSSSSSSSSSESESL